MTTSEMVLEFLRQQGFCPNLDDNQNIVFKSEMKTFLFLNNDSDEEFFQLALPGIYDVSEENRELVLEACNKVNFNVKVAKACLWDDTVWVFFEIILDQTPDVSTIIPRALGILKHAQQSFYEALQ